MKISEELRNNNVRYITDEIEMTCKTFGDRDPGSEGETKAVEHMAEELRKYCDDVKVESFEVHPKSFFGWIPYTVISVVLGFISYFFLPILALCFVALGIFIMVFQFLFYGEIMDKLFPKKTSHNVTAVKKPTGEIKRRIFFNGHPDAVWEWPLNYYFGSFMNSIVPVGAIVSAAAIFILSLVRTIEGGIVAPVIAEGAYLYAGLAMLIFLPFWIGMFFFVNFKRVVPGANDNLTACYMSIALIKALKEAGIELENTEIGAIISGSEEAGVRGARAWAKAHKGEYQDAETIIISMETLREVECLTIFNKDLNGLVPVDAQVCKLLKNAGEKEGTDIRYYPVTVGATDSVAFHKGGFRAACLGGLNYKLQKYYHTREDDYDNLSPECLKKVMDIMISAIELFDRDGLPPAE